MRRLCVILLSLMVVYGCSDLENTWDRWMGNDDDDDAIEVASAEPQKAEEPKAKTEPAKEEPKEEPKKLPTPKPKTTTTKAANSKEYHHYNPQAWHRKGVALVLCYGASRMDWCSINGERMVLHGGRDKGRYVYSHYGNPGMGGKITCQRGKKTYVFSVKGGRSIQFGKCG